MIFKCLKRFINCNYSFFKPTERSRSEGKKLMKTKWFRLRSTDFCLGLFLFSQLTFAAEETLKKSPISPQVGSNVTNVSATSLAQMIVALIFILIAIVALGWLSKRVVGAGKNSGGRIKVLSGASVGSRERVVLIQVGQEQMLIGVAPGNVNKLHHFDKPVVENVETDPKMAPFAQKLQQLMKNSQMKKDSGSKESVIEASIKEKVTDDEE